MIVRARLSTKVEGRREAWSDWIQMTQFQRAMYRWSRWHPYYAMAVAELDGSPDLGRLRESVRSVLDELGMGTVEVDEREREYRFADRVDVVDVEEDRLAADTSSARERWLSNALNFPMIADGRFPLRVRVLAQGTRQYVVHIFDHWIGDSWVLCQLVDSVLRRYLGVGQSGGESRIVRRGVDLRRVLPGDMTFRRRIGMVRESIGTLVAMRNCYRPCSSEGTDLSSDVRIPALPENLLERFVRSARQHRCTVNDVFLAATLESAAAATPGRVMQTRRRDLAVAGVSDLRSLAPCAFAGRMGLYLGYYQVFLREQSCPSFEKLISVVRGQTARMKRLRMSLRAELELGYNQWIWRYLSEEERQRQLRNNHPVAAGTSNLRVPHDCFGSELFPMLRQLRFVVSPGPTTPLIVHSTTSGDAMSVSLTWRHGTYRRDQVETFLETFGRRVERL